MHRVVFLVGLVFSAMGLLLFAAGANGKMQLKSSAKWLPMTLSATAYGLAVLILGGIIISIAVSKDVSRNISAEMNLPGSGKSSGDMKRFVSTGTSMRQQPPADQTEMLWQRPCGLGAGWGCGLGTQHFGWRGPR